MPHSPFSLTLQQFSENGLVQFQSVIENEQYLFPAPLANGFPDNNNVSLLAAFWDDVDLTHGDGRLLYQVRSIRFKRRFCVRLLLSCILLLLLSFRSTVSLIQQTCTPRRCSVVQQRKCQSLRCRKAGLLSHLPGSSKSPGTMSCLYSTITSTTLRLELYCIS